MQTTDLKLDLIRIDGGTQPRESIDESLVAEYAESVEDLPPMVVYYDGTDYWLADGFHRWHALRRAKVVQAPCIVHKGERREAVLYSVGANAEHGKRRTNADKRKAVKTLLEDAEWGTWSDREIAKRCRVSTDLVGEMRPITHLSESTDAHTERKANRGGTTYTVKTENIGKSPPARRPPPPPVAPLTPFQIAEQGVAPLKELLSLINDAIKASEALAQNKEVGHYFRHQQAIDGLNTAKGVVKFAMPKSPCPYMPNCQQKCKCCRGAGWIPKDIYDKLNKTERAMLEGNP